MVDLNTYIQAERGSRFAASGIKKEQTDLVYWACKVQKVSKVTNYPVTIKFTWYSKNKRKDIDNISFAKKYILDGLVQAMVLEDDSRKFVTGFEETFLIDIDNPRVEVEIKYHDRNI